MVARGTLMLVAFTTLATRINPLTVSCTIPTVCNVSLLFYYSSGSRTVNVLIWSWILKRYNFLDSLVTIYTIFDVFIIIQDFAIPKPRIVKANRWVTSVTDSAVMSGWRGRYQMRLHWRASRFKERKADLHEASSRITVSTLLKYFCERRTVERRLVLVVSCNKSH